MLAHTDLFAYDAKYHRTCYAAYITKKNIKATKAKTETIQSKATGSKAFNQSCNEINTSVFSEPAQITTLSAPYERFTASLMSIIAFINKQH